MAFPFAPKPAPFTAAGMMERIRTTFQGLPDARRGGNHQRDVMEDAALSAPLPCSSPRARRLWTTRLVGNAAWAGTMPRAYSAFTRSPRITKSATCSTRCPRRRSSRCLASSARGCTTTGSCSRSTRSALPSSAGRHRVLLVAEHQLPQLLSPDPEQRRHPVLPCRLDRGDRSTRSGGGGALGPGVRAPPRRARPTGRRAGRGRALVAAMGWALCSVGRHAAG
jgi:hypothetical protein